MFHEMREGCPCIVPSNSAGYLEHEPKVRRNARCHDLEVAEAPLRCSFQPHWGAKSSRAWHVQAMRNACKRKRAQPKNDM